MLAKLFDLTTITFEHIVFVFQNNDRKTEIHRHAKLIFDRSHTRYFPRFLHEDNPSVPLKLRHVRIFYRTFFKGRKFRRFGIFQSFFHSFNRKLVGVYRSCCNTFDEQSVVQKTIAKRITSAKIKIDCNFFFWYSFSGVFSFMV